MKRYVFTGAPGSGKSVLLLELERRGIAVVPEAAEDIIKLEQALGDESPWEHPNFQDKIIHLQLKREQLADCFDGKVFFDRGVLDGLAYFQIQGRKPSQLMNKAMMSKRYEGVFLIELGNDCKKTGIRREDMEEALRLQELQFRNYSAAGYKVQRIHYMPIKERADLVLEKLDS